jgi:dynein heavy chain 2
MQKNTEFFLYDVSGYKKFLSSLKGLLAEFKKSKQDYFQDWCETTLSNISDQNSNICLETNGKLMELNHQDGKLDVLYGDRLITLLREVRQLKSYGFKIPSKIDDCAKVGQKFQKHAMILKQVN